jgi:hypothetical protein
MVNKSDSTRMRTPELPRVPVWATPRGTIESDVDAAYAAGAALTALDQLVRTDSDWLGAWRNRLALKAATQASRLAGRREEEADLRDAWHLRQSGDALGPSGEILHGWRRLAARSSPPDTVMIKSIAEQLGIGWTPDLNEISECVALQVASGLPAPLVAAEAASLVVARHPKAELLAWWVADCALSMRMRWPIYVPVIATELHSPMLRLGEERRRARAGSAEFSRAVCIAVALSAAKACMLGEEIAVQAAKLRGAEPKLRSKSAHLVIEQLLNDDSVSGSFTTKTLSRWASRRLFDRLIQLDAVRELSGRDTFKIFGL